MSMSESLSLPREEKLVQLQKATSEAANRVGAGLAPGTDFFVVLLDKEERLMVVATSHPGGAHDLAKGMPTREQAEEYVSICDIAAEAIVADGEEMQELLYFAGKPSDAEEVS